MNLRKNTSETNTSDMLNGLPRISENKTEKAVKTKALVTHEASSDNVTHVHLDPHVHFKIMADSHVESSSHSFLCSLV